MMEELRGLRVSPWLALCGSEDQVKHVLETGARKKPGASKSSEAESHDANEPMLSIVSGASHSVLFVRTCVLASIRRRVLRAWCDFFASGARCHVSWFSAEPLLKRSGNYCSIEVAHYSCRPFKKVSLT